MMQNTDIISLAAVFSLGSALAFLSAITALWPYAPNQEGLAFFAFSLAVSFATALGNVTLLGTKYLKRANTAHPLLNRISTVLAAIVCMLGFLTTAILFSEGLNTWFTEYPVMPGSLIILFRFILLGPIFWILVVLFLTLFSFRK